MQPAFYPSQWGQKAESYTLMRHYVHKPSVAIILQKCVCVCVYFTVESLLTFRRCHEDRTFRRFPFCYETAVQMLLFYKDGYLRRSRAQYRANCCFLRSV